MDTNSQAYKVLLAQLRNGAVDVEEAANAAGINTMTLFKVLERGKIEESRIGSRNVKPRKTEEECLKIWVETRQALASASIAIQTAYWDEAKEDWRGALSWLERRNPMHFSKVSERMEITGIKNKIEEIEGK